MYLHRAGETGASVMLKRGLVASLFLVTSASLAQAVVYSVSLFDNEVGPFYVISYDINYTGQVVGTAQNSVGEQRAFLWTAGRMRDLNNLIDPYDPFSYKRC